MDTCDKLIWYFGKGKYVVKAMKLKMKYQPLTLSQQNLYKKEKYCYCEKNFEAHKAFLSEGRAELGTDVRCQQHK
ncbi:MAG: hypothetical protein HUJ74_00445 [Lachnospiraceae bacterium]|nr:hypothetical protein [Lachnospiraceae bacterium]